MYKQPNFRDVVQESFKEHGIKNQNLENAIVDILNKTIDSRTLARHIHKHITEEQERERRIKNMFK